MLSSSIAFILANKPAIDKKNFFTLPVIRRSVRTNLFSEESALFFVSAALSGTVLCTVSVFSPELFCAAKDTLVSNESAVFAPSASFGSPAVVENSTAFCTFAGETPSFLWTLVLPDAFRFCSTFLRFWNFFFFV